jgi:IclR family transcriptional regulator, KDG regulon repressor
MAAEPNSTEKVLRILKAFPPDNRPRGTLELCSDLGMKPATVSRLLGILREHQFVQQTADRKYQLGEAAAALGQAVNESKTARQLAVIEPQLMRLRNLLNENIHLEHLYGNNVRIAVVLTGTKSVHITAQPGTWIGINATAGSKAILAFLAPERLRGIMKAHPVLTKFRPNTLTNWKELRKQLEEIRKSGLAYDHLEYMEDICAVGTPVFDHTGAVFGAVVIPVPVQRAAILSEKKTIDLLKATAKNITANLGDLPSVSEK